jgi:hypothetical protein
MYNQHDLYGMSTKLERTPKKDVKYANSMDKWIRYTISLGIGCFLGLFIFLLANPFYTSSYSGAEVKNVVANCKASVVEFVPLGSIP